MPEQALGILKNLGFRARLGAEETLFLQDELQSVLYLVMGGSVIWGDDIYGPGTLLDEAAFLADLPVGESCRTREETILFMVAKGPLLRSLGSSPEALRAYLAILVDRLKRSNEL